MGAALIAAGPAIMAGVGAATQLAGAGMSFAQAKKQKELKAEADRAAAQAMIKQDNLLRTNYAEQLQVPLEAYEQASQANAAIQAQNIDAMRQSGDRALIGGVGRTMAAGDAANERMRMQMQRDLYERDQRVAAEDDRIRNMRRDVELQRASGAQQAAAQAEIQRQRSLAQGVSALGGAASTGLQGMGLYTGGGLTNPFGGNGGSNDPMYTPTDGTKPTVTGGDPFGGTMVPGGDAFGFNYNWDPNLGM